MINTQPSILLIDDDAGNLKALADELSRVLTGSMVRTWRPSEDDGDLYEAFATHLGDSTRLVITDYDLTTGVRGLFGLSIVGWCQRKAIPVGDFSRGRRNALPSEPNLFELRVPTEKVEAAAFIKTLYDGFESLRRGITEASKVPWDKASLGVILAQVLSRPSLESQFSAYMSRLGAANSALMQQLSDNTTGQLTTNAKVDLLTYILGHVLVNSILKYPGPILSENALCAYVTAPRDEIDEIAPLFSEARYEGPFDSAQRYFWRDDVDAVIDRSAGTLSGTEFADFADYNRAVVEACLRRSLRPHVCDRDRCGGKKGGFWCPFSCRPVCVREDCSVPSSSWIPDGAQLCRVERNFYEEWAPLLGL
jgi:hypothetical protein